VEIGESVEAAARREAHEETALDGLRLVGELGSLAITLPEEWRAVVRATKLFDEPAHDASTTGFHCPRGAYLRYVRPAGPFAEVAFEEADLNGDPPVVSVLATGFVRESVLTRRLERYFYHFLPGGPTGEAWDVAIDGHVFHLFWTALRRDVGLMPPQDNWLAHVYDRLVASVQATAGG
jgi:ADP-ribose pyrophosphatase YjhB (NUDIX family)